MKNAAGYHPGPVTPSTAIGAQLHNLNRESGSESVGSTNPGSKNIALQHKISL